MTDRLIKLDGYMPVRVAGKAGLCQHLSLERLLVDLPKGTRLSGEQGLSLICSEDFSVSVRVRVLGIDAHRHDLEILEFLGAGREKLVGHISSLRKSAHLNIVAQNDVQAATTRAGWDRYRFSHEALPEVHADHIDLTTTFLGKPLAAPLVIAGMTGGSERAGTVNRRLAEAVQALGLGMGLGSQRAMLESPALAPTFQIRDVAPDILLLANIGAVQLNYGVGIDAALGLVDAVQADALAVHLNVLQEMVQPEGDRDWRGLLARIGALVEASAVPVLVKETGCGISPTTARHLRDLGVAAIDVGGTGGTSWGWIEGFRAADPHRQAIGATFRDWGIPTAESLVAVREALGPDYPLMSTGGVRSGLDVAKAVALGANVAGMALPFFRAADDSTEDVLALGRRILEEVRIAMVCSGCGDVGSLASVALEEQR
jgi:isopentenyl-diphosphate delta-isomerase